MTNPTQPAEGMPELPVKRIPITSELIARAKELFEYRDGKLYWRVKPRHKSVQVGDEAGVVTRGYAAVKFDGRIHRVHRIIFAMHHGYAPEYVDHANGDTQDNRIENLRPASASQNGHNRGFSRLNRSGVKGVCWNSRSSCWRARVTVDKKTYFVGLFDDALEAAKALERRRVDLIGEFAKNVVKPELMRKD